MCERADVNGIETNRIREASLLVQQCPVRTTSAGASVGSPTFPSSLEKGFAFVVRPVPILSSTSTFGGLPEHLRTPCACDGCIREDDSCNHLATLWKRSSSFIGIIDDDDIDRHHDHRCVTPGGTTPRASGQTLSAA